MKKRILLLGFNLPNGLMIQKFKDEYGENLEFFTVEEAETKGLSINDFDNIKKYKIEAPPAVQNPYLFIEPKKLGKGGKARKRSNYRK